MTGPLIVNCDFEGLPLTSTVKCLSKGRITWEVPSWTRQRKPVTIVPLQGEVDIMAAMPVLHWTTQSCDKRESVLDGRGGEEVSWRTECRFINQPSRCAGQTLFEGLVIRVVMEVPRGISFHCPSMNNSSTAPIAKLHAFVVMHVPVLAWGYTDVTASNKELLASSNAGGSCKTVDSQGLV